MGYVVEGELESSGVRPKSYALSDRGVKLFRVLNEYEDVLVPKVLNKWSVLF